MQGGGDGVVVLNRNGIILIVSISATVLLLILLCIATAVIAAAVRHKHRKRYIIPPKIGKQNVGLAYFNPMLNIGASSSTSRIPVIWYLNIVEFVVLYTQPVHIACIFILLHSTSYSMFMYSTFVHDSQCPSYSTVLPQSIPHPYSACTLLAAYACI